MTTQLEPWLAAGRPEGEFTDLLRGRLADFRRLGAYFAVTLLDAQGQLVLAGLAAESIARGAVRCSGAEPIRR